MFWNLHNTKDASFSWGWRSYNLVLIRANSGPQTPTVPGVCSVNRSGPATEAAESLAYAENGHLQTLFFQSHQFRLVAAWLAHVVINARLLFRWKWRFHSHRAGIEYVRVWRWAGGPLVASCRQQRRERPTHVVSSPLVHKTVENGVGYTVEAGQRQRHVIRCK